MPRFGDALSGAASSQAEVTLPIPDIAGKAGFTLIYSEDDFVAHLRKNNWEPGPVPAGVILTYGGFDLLSAADTDESVLDEPDARTKAQERSFRALDCRARGHLFLGIGRRRPQWRKRRCWLRWPLVASSASEPPAVSVRIKGRAMSWS